MKRRRRKPLPPGPGANTDKKLTTIRQAMAKATSKHTIGGQERKFGGPKPVTLPKLKAFVEDDWD